MRLFKSNVPYLRKIEVDDEKNEITLFHSDGANKFSKQDVLDWDLTNDIHSVPNYDESLLKLVNYFIVFILFGGFLNMYHSIFPIFIEKRILSPLATTHGFWTILVLDLFLAVVSAYVVFLGIKFLLTINARVNDILIINLNNQNVKIRFEGKRNHENPFNRLINFLPPKYGGWKDVEVLDENILYLSNKKFLWFLGLYVVLSAILFLFNVDAPFIFNRMFQSSFLGIDVPYWEYFGTWSTGKVVYHIHPCNAFLDGLVSNFILPVFLLLTVVFIYLVVCFSGLPFFALSFMLVYLNFNFSEKFQLLGRISGWCLSFIWYPLFTIFDYENYFILKRVSSLRISHSKYNIVKFLEGVILTILSLFFILSYSITSLMWLINFFSTSALKSGTPLIFYYLTVIISGVIGLVLYFILNKLLDDEELNEKIEISRVSKDGLLLKTSPFRYRNAKFVVIEAVKNNGLALQFASRKLKHDKEVVMIAVKNNALALQYASSNLRNDKEVVKIAVQSNDLAFQFVSKKLSNDGEFVLSALKENSLKVNLELDGVFDFQPNEYDNLAITTDFSLTEFFHLFPIQTPDFISQRMVFTTFNKSQFIARGKGFVGIGSYKLVGSNQIEGSYTWKYDNSSVKGETVIHIDTDGHFRGKVYVLNDKNVKEFNWEYIAKRVSDYYPERAS